MALYCNENKGNLLYLFYFFRFRSKPVQGWSIAWTPCEDFDMFTTCKGVGVSKQKLMYSMKTNVGF